MTKILIIAGVVLCSLTGIATPAHAQKSALVQCEAGGTYNVPDYACDALLAGFAQLQHSMSTDQPNNRPYYMECATTISKHLKLPGGMSQAASLCTQMETDYIRYHPYQAMAARKLQEKAGRERYARENPDHPYGQTCGERCWPNPPPVK